MRLRSLLDELGAVRDESPRQLIDRTVNVLRVAAEADVALFYTSAMVDTETLRAVDWSVAGHGQRAADVRETFEGGFTASSTTAMGPQSWETRFIRLEELARRMPAATARMAEEVTDPIGVIDQAILPLSHAGRYLGPIVAVRFADEEPFDARGVAGLRTLVAPIGGRLVTATRMLRTGCPADACDLLVDATGQVEYASVPSRSWLDDRDVVEELRRVVRRVDSGRHAGPNVPFRGARARVVRLERDHSVRYLVHLEPPSPLSTKHSLTEAERDVALLAAAGATAGDIAAIRGTTVGTVRSQLKSIYASLEVTTRVELAQMLGV